MPTRTLSWKPCYRANYTNAKQIHYPNSSRCLTRQTRSGQLISSPPKFSCRHLRDYRQNNGRPCFNFRKTSGNYPASFRSAPQTSRKQRKVRRSNHAKLRTYCLCLSRLVKNNHRSNQCSRDTGKLQSHCKTTRQTQIPKRTHRYPVALSNTHHEKRTSVRKTAINKTSGRQSSGSQDQKNSDKHSQIQTGPPNTNNKIVWD